MYLIESGWSGRVPLVSVVSVTPHWVVILGVVSTLIVGVVMIGIDVTVYRVVSGVSIVGVVMGVTVGSIVGIGTGMRVVPIVRPFPISTSGSI